MTDSAHGIPHSALRIPHSALPTISVIAAVSENNVIGRDGALPWHLPADLKRFKQLTLGHAIIMGRKTWESIGRPLPERTSIVISRQTDWDAADAIVAADLDGAVQAAGRIAAELEEVFVIGGAAIYSLALPRADQLYLTRVHATVDGNVKFPAVDWNQWQLIEESHHAADERNEYECSFQTWRRNPKSH